MHISSSSIFKYEGRSRLREYAVRRAGVNPNIYIEYEYTYM